MIHGVQFVDYFFPSLIFAIIGYLLGSISFSVILSKAFLKEDVRNRNSGNAGATNVARSYGYKYGFSVLFLDMIKGFLAMLVTVLLQNNVDWFVNGTILITLLFTFIGHRFPIFFKFKGGKNAACFGGAMIFYAPIIGVFVCIAAFIILLMWKRASVSSLLASLIGIVVLWILTITVSSGDVWLNGLFLNKLNSFNHLQVNAVIWTICLLILWACHYENIIRIINKQEKPMNLKKPNTK